MEVTKPQSSDEKDFVFDWLEVDGGKDQQISMILSKTAIEIPRIIKESHDGEDEGVYNRIHSELKTLLTDLVNGDPAISAERANFISRYWRNTVMVPSYEERQIGQNIVGDIPNRYEKIMLLATFINSLQ